MVKDDTFFFDVQIFGPAAASVAVFVAIKQVPLLFENLLPVSVHCISLDPFASWTEFLLQILFFVVCVFSASVIFLQIFLFFSKSF